MRYCLFVLLFISYIAGAQNKSSFEHLTIEDGLANNSVRIIFQDKQGYMWLGTLNGLSRYDGQRFETFNYNISDTYSNSNNKIRYISQDRLGYIWLLTYGETAHRFNPETETFLNFPEALDDSLNIKEIHSIYESSPGVIWMTIPGKGCMRVIYNKNSTNIKTDWFNTRNLLPSNSINFIQKSRKKGVWIGTDAGLCYFPDDKISTTNPGKSQELLRLPFYEVLKLYESDSAVWAGTKDGELFRIKNNKDTLIWRTPNWQKGRSYITAINKSATGLLCVCSLKGLLLLNEKTNKKAYYSTRNSKLNTSYIASCFHDKHDDFWLITSKRGITRFEVKKRKFTNYPLNPEIRQSILEGEKQQFCEDKNGDLWISIYGGGISKFNRETETFEQYLHDENNPGSLSSNLILSLYCDKSGNIWAGSYKRGINKINLHRSHFHSLQLNKSETKDFSNEVRAIFEDSRKWIWTGNKQGDIVVFDQNMHKLFALNDLNVPEKITSGIYTFEEDKQHRIWIGTKGQGIYIIENLPSKISLIPGFRLKYSHLTRSKKNNTLTHNAVFDLHEDQSGQMWVALYHGGINVIQNPLQASQRILEYVQNNKDTFSISDDRVRCISEDKAGNMWLGTVKGLNFLEAKYKNSDNKKFKVITPSNLKSFANYDIVKIYQSSQGKIWIGTYGEGAFCLSPPHGRLKPGRQGEIGKITPVNDLSSNLVFSFIEDNNKNLWIGTDFGLNKLTSGKTEKFYDVSGLTENSFSEGKGIKTSKGNIIFGHISGMVWFSPNSIHKSIQKVPVVLTRLTINGENNKEKLIQARHIIRKEQNVLHLKHNENFLTFEFAALDYKAPKEIQYTYKLEGHEQKWNTEGNRNIAIYRDLRPGEYLLRMKASNSAGMWVNPEMKLKIAIAPPPWKTFWAYLLYSLLAFIAFFFARRFFLERIRLKHEVAFEKQLVDEKIKFYTSTSHELKTPLALIYGMVEDLLGSKKMAKNIRESLYTVRKNTNRLMELIDQLMDFRKIQKGVFSINKQQGNPTAFLNEIYQAFLPLSKRRQIAFSFQHNNNNCQNAFTDYKALEKIIFNLLSNAFKHTGIQKTIELELSSKNNPEKLIISVKDQGEGINAEDLPHIFDRFSFGKSQLKEESSSGIGLSLCKELTDLLGGTITVTSQPGKGSCFTVFLPVEKDTSPGKATQENYVLDYTNQFIKGIDKEQISQEDKQTDTSTKSETILVVEDNLDLQAFLKNHLTKHYNVLQAFNGKDGLKLAREKSPDIIICDIMMPEMDGLEMTSILKDEFRTSHIPVILLTAKSMDIHKIEGIEVGADDYITKPFNMEYLQKRVKNILIQRKQLKERFSHETESQPAELTNTEKDEEFISKVIELIEENMRNSDFSVDTLIKHFNFGRTVFYQKMKGISGYAPNDFIRIIRMKKAARLLLEHPELNVAEISFIMGYNETPYFSKIFRKHFGQNPSEYRKSRRP